MNRRHITRTTFSDGSTIAELWLETTDDCPHCGAAAVWCNPAGGYHTCVSCQRGWEFERAPIAASKNAALAQVVEQLARAV